MQYPLLFTVKFYDENARAFVIDLIIRSHINVIFDSAYFSRELFSTLVFGNNVFPCTIVLNHMINF